MMCGMCEGSRDLVEAQEPTAGFLNTWISLAYHVPEAST